jgi:hypothetical protein
VNTEKPNNKGEQPDATGYYRNRGNSRAGRIDLQMNRTAKYIRSAWIRGCFATMALLFGLFSFPAETIPAGRSIGITLLQNLDFGSLGVATTSGTATVDANGIKTVSAGILDLGGVALPAVFQITGEKNVVFTITLPASATINPIAGAGVLLTDFQSTPSLTGILDNTGKATVTVGATINLSPGMPESTYSGPFDIQVSY